jgi:phospholipid/cholesterol/gamma-HCH transport system permease protein
MAEARAGSVVSELGRFFDLCLRTGIALRKGVHVEELLEQAVFIIRVSLLPVVFLTLPLTVVVQFFIGQLLSALGAQDLAGAGAGLAVVQELGPFASVLVVAGAGATAVCADLGSRRIREELDAMETLGIDLVSRLVVPRILAFAIVSVGLFCVVVVVGIAGTFAFSSLVQGGSPGLFISDLTLLTGVTDFVVGIVKTMVFGIAAGLVACHLGLRAKGGPQGVGDAVNLTVIYSLMLLIVLNTLITSIYLQLGGH